MTYRETPGALGEDVVGKLARLAELEATTSSLRHDLFGLLAPALLVTDRLLARSQEAEVKERLLQGTAQSVERGAFGAPTFFVGDAMFFGKDQLRDVEEAVVEASSAASLAE